MSSLPTHWGEKVCMRVPNKESIVVDLEDLGLSSADYPIVLRGQIKPFQPGISGNPSDRPKQRLEVEPGG